MSRATAYPGANPDEPTYDESDWRSQRWAEESEPLTAARKLEATVSVRFGPDDALLLRRAARMSGMTKSEFVRRSTIQAARQTIDARRPAIVFVPMPAQSPSVVTRSSGTGVRSAARNVQTTRTEASSLTIGTE
jgi:hypothetical protein